MKWIFSVLALLAMMLVSSGTAEAQNWPYGGGGSVIRCSPTVSWQQAYSVRCDPYSGCRIYPTYSRRVVYRCRREYSPIWPVQVNPRPVSGYSPIWPVQVNPRPVSGYSPIWPVQVNPRPVSGYSPIWPVQVK